MMKGCFVSFLLGSLVLPYCGFSASETDFCFDWNSFKKGDVAVQKAFVPLFEKLMATGKKLTGNDLNRYLDSLGIQDLTSLEELASGRGFVEAKNDNIVVKALNSDDEWSSDYRNLIERLEVYTKDVKVDKNQVGESFALGDYEWASTVVAWMNAWSERNGAVLSNMSGWIASDVNEVAKGIKMVCEEVGVTDMNGDCSSWSLMVVAKIQELQNTISSLNKELVAAKDDKNKMYNAWVKMKEFALNK